MPRHIEGKNKYWACECGELVNHYISKCPKCGKQDEQELERLENKVEYYKDQIKRWKKNSDN